MMTRSALMPTMAALTFLTLSLAAAPDLVRSGPSTCGTFALTFDLCPVLKGSGFNAPLVHFLVEHHVPATFFLSGTWIDTHAAETRELLAVPFFELGTHGDHHAHLPRLTPAGQRAEIDGAVTRLRTTYGRPTTLFRPPYGEYTPQSLTLAEAEDLRVVLWSVVSGDPDPNLSAAAITRDVDARTRAGSIVIFHANGRGWHTAEIVPDVYRDLVERKRLTPVTVSDLLRGCAGNRVGAPSAARQ